ncbi:MAG: class II aldolase/adducin family protein [Candidatus Enterenecus sp.]
MNWKQQVIDAGVRMLRSGATIGTWGNISLRDPDSGTIYLTPSGMDYDRLTEADIVALAPDGTVREGTRRPSTEKALHLAVYRARPEICAVVHTHPIYSTAFAAMGEEIPLLLDEAAQVLGAPVQTAKYALPGSVELAENCVAALGERGMACLLRSHGAVCLGTDLDRALTVSAVLEATARVYLYIRAMGGSYCPISEDDIARMQHFVRHSYGQTPEPQARD